MVVFVVAVEVDFVEEEEEEEEVALEEEEVMRK